MATGSKKRQYLTLVMTDDLKKIDLQHIDQTNDQISIYLFGSQSKMTLKW